MVIVRMGLCSDSIKRFPNKLSYNEIFKMNLSVWRDVRSRNGSWSGIVRLREGNRVWRVSPDSYVLGDLMAALGNQTSRTSNSVKTTDTKRHSSKSLMSRIG